MAMDTDILYTQQPKHMVSRIIDMSIRASTSSQDLWQLASTPDHTVPGAPRVTLLAKTIGSIPTWAAADHRTLTVIPRKPIIYHLAKPRDIRATLHPKAQWIWRPETRPPAQDLENFWNLPPIAWKKLFRARIPHKALQGWYRTLHGKIPTRSILYFHNVPGVDSPNCLICNNDTLEDPVHFWLSCPHKRAVWSYVWPGMRWNALEDRLFKATVYGPRTPSPLTNWSRWDGLWKSSGDNTSAQSSTMSLGRTMWPVHTVRSN